MYVYIYIYIYIIVDFLQALRTCCSMFYCSIGYIVIVYML